MKKLVAAAAAVVVLRSGLVQGAACGTANVPAATLLAPYFRVSRNGVAGSASDIPDVAGQTDTLMSLTNVSQTGLIVHVTVWNKYAFPVLNFNVPLTAYDVVSFRMKDVLNGKLNVNPLTQTGTPAEDPCGLNQSTGAYQPVTGFGATRYVRFPNPEPADALGSVSIYQTPAFSGPFRATVWDALDESGDLTMLSSPGAFVLDKDTTCAEGSGGDGKLSGDFSGYVTFDVVNYCTAHAPSSAAYYQNDALATAGWDGSGGSPNALIGDVFYIDASFAGPHISGIPMVALEFDAARADWRTSKTFYGRYASLGTGDADTPAGVPSSFRFVGDGREPLGTKYGFRYLNDPGQGMRSWAMIFRSDRTPDGADDLCRWRNEGGKFGAGYYDATHQLNIRTLDSDENEFVVNGGGGPPNPLSAAYAFLATQRVDLLDLADVNPGGYKGGYMEIAFPGDAATNQAWVGIQHSGRGQLLSAGHGAALLDRAMCER